jgi:predicted Zn-dependent peptidase
MNRFMHTSHRVAAVLLPLVLVVGLAVAAETGEEREKPWERIEIPELGEIKIPAYQRIELDNGMVVYLAEDHKLPLIQLSATIRVGGIYEPAEKIGLASITGSVMRTGGTTTRTGDEIDALVEAKGMSLETWIGLETGGVYLSALKEDVNEGFDLLADVLRNPVFDQDKIDITKGQQKSAIARRNDQPRAIIMREGAKILYGANHPLARHTEYATIDAISRDDLIAFHRRYIHPDRIYLVVIGDFSSQEMIALIKSTLGDWQRATEPLPPDPEIPHRDRTVNVINRDELTQSSIILGHLGIRADDPSYAGITVANRILGGSFSSRLHREVRSNRGYAYAVSSSAGTGFRFPGIFVAFCGTKSASTEAATAVIIDEITRMTTEPVSAEELTQAKDAILNAEVFNFDTKREVMDRQVLYEMYGYEPDFLQRYQDEVRAMAPEKVLAAAKAVWHPERLSIIVVGKLADLDGDLSKFGEVQELDITIPEPEPDLEIPDANEESLSQGQELMSRAAVAVGIDSLEEMTGIYYKGTMVMSLGGQEMTVAIESTFALPDRAHLVQTLPFGSMTMVVDGEAGWMSTPRGLQDLPPDRIKSARQGMDTNLHMLLFNRASLKCQSLGPVEIDGVSHERVYITGELDDHVILYLDSETGRPLQMEQPGQSPGGGPATELTRYTEMQSVDGIEVPKSYEVTLDGEPFATGTIEVYKLNPEIDPGLFEKGVAPSE